MFIIKFIIKYRSLCFLLHNGYTRKKNHELKKKIVRDMIASANIYHYHSLHNKRINELILFSVDSLEDSR